MFLFKYMEKKGLEKEEVARVLGCAPSRLDAIEEGKVSLGVSDLLTLATLLDTDLPALLHGKEYEEKRAIKTALEDRVKVRHLRALDYESLAPSYVGRRMEPFLVTIYRGEDKDAEISHHNGEEFLYILKGRLKLVVDGVRHILEEGDSFYFDSSLPHWLNAVTPKVDLVASIYKGDAMAGMPKGRRMKSIIDGAKLLPSRRVVVVAPDRVALSAVNLAIEEEVVERVWLVGKKKRIKERCRKELRFPRAYRYVEVEEEGEAFEEAASKAGVDLVRRGKAHMIMKGKANTHTFLKSILKKGGIGTGRRLSLVGIFEVPGIHRLLMLTDPGINPELFSEEKVASGVDIVQNAIDVARALGVDRPKVALLEANEVPTDAIPTTLFERDLSNMVWENADVAGPLSYDLALYEAHVKTKGLCGHPVAGRADILVVPYIATGNILYKSWAMTMGAEVANVVLGASAPVILTSRSDTDMVKFLTICASALYSGWLESSRSGGL